MGRTTGARSLTRNRQPRARDRIWQSMRILGRFSTAELMATAEAGRANVDKYLRGLVRSGFVRLVKPKANGAKGGHAIYQLIRNTGPRAPRMQSGGVTFDPNTRTNHPGGIEQ